MHIEFLLFSLYLICCFWFFPRTSIVKTSGLKPLEVRILLAIKLVSAIVIAWYFLRLPYSDYQTYNNEGDVQYQLLKANPVAFFTDFGDVDAHMGVKGLFASSYSFWADIRFSLLYKIIAIFNLVTSGNFYLNSMLFSSIVFFGHVAFYTIFRHLYPTKKWPLIITCFLLPSLLMYTCCVHKDGFVFLAMAAMGYVFSKFLKNVEWPGLTYILVFIIALFTIFLFRNYVLVAMLPAMFTAFLCRVLPFRRSMIVFGSYFIYILLFFLSGAISPSLNLPEAVIKRKADFAMLEKGNTTMAMNDLQPGITSFLSNIPQAINHTLMRPYLWESRQPGVILAALELFVYQILMILFIFYRHKKREPISNFNIFGILFFISMMIIIGYTIPNIGAIVRYRSIFWILLICPIVCNIHLGKLRGSWLQKDRGVQ